VRALVADGDETRRAALVEELRRHGHDVEVVSTTRELLSAEGVELVALGDHPQDDVIEVVRALRAGHPDEELILLVLGDDERLDVVAALEAGASDVWGVPSGGAADVPRDARVRLSMAEHYARLQAEVVRVGGEFTLLRRALDLTGTGFVLTDPRLDDNPIVYANESFLELTGFPREEVLGRNCRFLQGQATADEDIDVLRRAIADARPITVELLNHRYDGSVFHNEVHISPVRDERGEVVRFVGVQIDVSAYRDVELAGRRSAFLAEAGPVIDATLDVRTTLEAIVRVSVPRLGDACLVTVLGADLERLALAADDARLRRILEGLPERYEVAADDPVVEAIHSGRSAVLRGELAASVLGPAAPELRSLRPATATVVPLRARGRALGALILLGLEGRDLATEDVPLAEELAHRAALAIDNARLYSIQRGVADALQASLLPGVLPSVDGLELAARYRPFGEGMEIGGDFYDAFATARGATALIVGDVTGKGAAAAAVTGLARHTLRAAADYEQLPSGVLAALNRALITDRASRGRYCTVAMAQLERDAQGIVATVSRAGHPTPYVVRADGRVEATGDRGTLLGYVPDPRLSDQTVRLHPGDALVLYTDGVSEAYEPRRATGESWVAELLQGARGEDAAELATRLERGALEAQGGRPRDDVAVAVARVVG
jgi:PAS domain S-box-containing protein